MENKKSINGMRDLMRAISMVLAVLMNRPKESPFITEEELLTTLSVYDLKFTPELLILIIGCIDETCVLTWMRSAQYSYDKHDPTQIAWAIAKHQEGLNLTSNDVFKADLSA